jgi:molybdate transport system substrate-binding protein
MSDPIKGISSMATRQLLADLLASFTQRTGIPVAMQSVGGVDASKRVLGGESFDVVVLAADAMDKLMASGCLVAGSLVAVARSGVAVAVQADAPRPDVSSEAALRAAILAAPSLSYSTGPSGVALAQLFERWGIAREIQERIVMPPPGVPVGSLVASGEVALGFQQLSELMHLQGIALLGALPESVQIITTFSAAIGAHCVQTQRVKALLEDLNSPQADALKQGHGMTAAL